MSTKLEIHYNPYKMKTEVLINGADVREELSHKEIKDFIENNIPLQTWVNKLPHKGWNGLLSHLIAEDDVNTLEVRFHGRKIDFEDLRRSLEAQNQSRTKKAFLEFPEQYQELKLSDEKMMQNIEHVVADLHSDKFKQIMDEYGDELVVKQEYLHLDANYEKAKNTKFRIVIGGTYSSGKSSLINALIRRQILPTANQTATTRVCSIIHDRSQKGKILLKAFDKDEKILVNELFETDKDCLDYFEIMTPSGKTESNPEGIASIKIYMDLSHLYPKQNREKLSKSLNLEILDTPGTDSGTSVQYQGETKVNMDRNSALDAINSENKDMVILCTDAGHYQGTSFGELIGEIHGAAAKDDGGFNDRFLFVLNKCDSATYDGRNEDLYSTKRQFSDALSKKEFWDQKNSEVYLIPRIFTTSARIELLVQHGVEKATDKYDRAKFQALAIDDPDPNCLLLPACDLPEYRKDELAREYEKVVQEERYDDAVSIQTGIPCVICAIQDYIERYAYPFKLRKLLETFDTLLEVISNFTDEQDKMLKDHMENLGKNSSAREEADEGKSKAENREKEWKDFKAQIDNIKKEILHTKPEEKEMDRLERDFNSYLEHNEAVQRIRSSSESTEITENKQQEIMSGLRTLLTEINKKIYKDYTDLGNRYDAKIRELAKKLNELAQKNIVSLKDLSAATQHLESVDAICNKLASDFGNSKREHPHPVPRYWNESGFGGVFGRIFNRFGWIRYTTETKVTYSLSDIKKTLTDFENSFKTTCHETKKKMQDNFACVKNKAIKIVEQVEKDLENTQKEIDAYVKKLGELEASSAELQAEIEKLKDRQEFLAGLKEQIGSQF